MEMTLLQGELLDGQLAVTKACVDAAANVLQQQGLLLHTVLEIPRISVESAGRVSSSILSTSVACTLSAAMLMVESFDRFPAPKTSSEPAVPAPTLDPKGGARKPRAVAAA